MQGEHKTESFNWFPGFSLERVGLKGNGPKWENRVTASGVPQKGIFCNFLTCELSINVNHRKERLLCLFMKQMPERFNGHKSLPLNFGFAICS